MSTPHLPVDVVRLAWHAAAQPAGWRLVCREWAAALLAALPTSFGALPALQYLDMSGCASLAALPTNFGALPALKYLNMSGCASLAALPADVAEGCCRS